MIAAWVVGGLALAAPPEVIELGRGYTHLYALVGEGVVIVDTGYPGDDVAVLKGLAEAGIAEDKVTAIVITHAHSDHTGGAARAEPNTKRAAIIRTPAARRPWRRGCRCPC